MKKDIIQESYDKWSEEVQNNIREIQKIFTGNPRKDIMQLKRQEKTENTISDMENALLWEDGHGRKNKTHNRTHNRQNSRDKRIIKVAQQIKSNIGNEGKIWAIKKKVQRKNLTTQRWKNNRIECLSQILEDYQRYYENLLKTRLSDSWGNAGVK